ncbi:MAG TPA: protein-disulfide reductase DsbD domain-containing protein [Bryobacteraceae bacterium]|nr:protein-disulfide reductase DsbD domain-containing protein [Bryobacteraceae bacterium]
MRSSNCSTGARAVARIHLLGALLLILPGFTRTALAQGNDVLSIAPVAKVSAERGKVISQKLDLDVRSGFHVNSNTPEDEFLIPLKLTWNKGPLEPAEVIYPKPTRETYSFSEKPLSVFTGKFSIVTRFRVSPQAGDMGVMTGRLRYQACNNKECLPPKTLNVQFSVDVR